MVLELLRAPLFVPATRPERFSKALASGADAVIIDLEDAVAHSEKDAARQVLREALPGLADRGRPVGVRINAASSEHLGADVELLGEVAEHLDFLVLPEVSGVHDLEALGGTRDPAAAPSNASSQLPVLALIESSRGLLEAAAIAAAPRVRRLALGAADLAEDWRIEPSVEEAEFDHARQHLVIASRAAGLAGPLDTPHMNVNDDDGLARRTRAVAQLGMQGKLCIHPGQVQTVLSGWVVSVQQHDQLRELVEVFEQAERSGNSSVRLDDGSFVDYPVYRRALRQIQAFEEHHRD